MGITEDSKIAKSQKLINAYFEGVVQSGGGSNLDEIPSEGEAADQFVGRLNEAMVDYGYVDQNGKQTYPQFRSVQEARQFLNGAQTGN